MNKRPLKTRSRAFDQYLYHESDIEGPGDPDQFYDALVLVGEVVMFFNALERDLERAICFRINDRSDSLGLLVMDGMMFKSKLRLFERIADDVHFTFGKQPDEYAGLIASLERAADLRNTIVHADWASADAEGFAYTKLRIKAGRMTQEYVQFTSESVESVLAEIDAARERLDNYLVAQRGLFG